MTAHFIATKKKLIGSAIAAGVTAMGFAGTAAQAQDEPALLAEDLKISFSAGVDYNTHFVSYGFDVWAQGADWGSRDTVNPWAEVAIAVGDFTFVTGLWGDINDNAPASLGGDIQEIDFWIGVGYGIEEFSFGITYQAWEYAGGTESILDLSFGYDDSALYGESGFALNPSLLLHKRLGTTNGTNDNGWVIVLGVEPSFTIIDSESAPIDLAIPVSLGFFPEDGFHAGDSGFGYFSIGAIFSMPLTFIPAEYGSWSIAAGVTFYHTEADVIPFDAVAGVGNPDEDFVTGTAGFSVSF